MKKNKRKKYAVGTKVNSFIETPTQALNKNALDMDLSMIEGMTNPFANVLDVVGNLAMQSGASVLGGELGNLFGGQNKKIAGDAINIMQDGRGDMIPDIWKNLQNNPTVMAAFGGKVPGVPVEIEGDEVGEMPNGKLFEAEGPSHEQGGIDITLPEGTEMYSKRIKVDGVSMADRKKKRKKKEVTLEELLNSNKTDKLLKNSLDRTKTTNAKEEKFDTEMQQTIKALLEPKTNNKTEHKWGDVVKSLTKNSGDILGMLGTAYGTFAPMQNTKNMRAGDTPNVNAYENFGVDALKAIEQSKDQVAIGKEDALSDIALTSASQTKRNRNSARGINQSRALDLATSMQDKKAVADVNVNAANILQSIFGQQAQLENQQDSMVMQGEQQKDTADRADRDAFYSQLSGDIANKAQGIMSFADSLNKQSNNKETLNMIAKLKESGINEAKLMALIEAINKIPGQKKNKE